MDNTEHPTPWKLMQMGMGSWYVVDARNKVVMWQGVRDGSEPPLDTLRFMVDCVNRNAPMSDPHLQAIRDRNEEYRNNLRAAWNESPVAEACLKSINDCHALLEEIGRLTGVLDDLFRDEGRLPVDAVPTLRVREENSELKEALRQILELCPKTVSDRAPAAYAQLVQKIQTVVKPLIGENNDRL